MYSMDKKRSVLNVAVAIGFKIIIMVMTIVVKRTLIQYCGNEVNGLNALFLSIIGVLSVAELGVGSAITFCMYKPIVDNNLEEVSALYHLFKKLYLIIGGAIGLVGLILTPFIRYLAKDYADVEVNFSVSFLLMLVSVVLSYFYSAKTSLINAYKNNYITTAITSGGILLQFCLQLIVLYLTKSFTCYLICRIVATLAQWFVTEKISNRKYRAIFTAKAKLKVETKSAVISSIRAMFMHKVGSVMVNTVDSMVIAAFIGVVTLGEYSNYQNLLAAVTGIIALVLSSLTSILGHLYVQKEPAVVEKYSRGFHLLNYCIGIVFYLGYFAVIDSLIEILFFKNLIISRQITFVITLNGFVQFMRYSTLTFRDATGTFYYDRWKPLIEGVANLALSIVFVKTFGVVGVLVATIATNLFICHIIEPYVLYKYAFGKSPVKHYLTNYMMIAVFFVAQLLLENMRLSYETPWKTLFANGCLSVVVSVVACALGFGMNIGLCKDLLLKVRKRNG